MPSSREIGTTLKEVRAYCEQHGIRIADLKFTDLPGSWQHFSVPLTQLDEGSFTEGLGFDGSSIRGFQNIDESDMMLVPDVMSVFVDPALKIPTVSFVCNVRDPVTGGPYSRDPRHVAQKAEAYLKSTGLADISNWGPELEHFVFDDVRFDQNEHSGYYFIDSEEGIWNSGRGDGPNLAHRPKYKQGYFPTPPTDALQDFRSECVLQLIDSGIDIEVHHHEVATAGQGEIDMRFKTLTRMADQVMMHKYIVKNVARAHGKVATFMPKPLFADNGSGMHVHQSLWKGDTNLFFDENGYALTSKMALNYIGGLFKHAEALLALIAPTTNSYRRLVPGYEAPVNLVYSQRNRSAAVRIPVYTTSPNAKRVEFRTPDPTCNPYLAFAAMLMAGLDGVINEIDPGEPLDKDLYDLPPEEAAKVRQVPGSVEEVLDALEKDHDFLFQGDVFTPDVITTWIDYKRKNEVDAVKLRPHPYEFYLYLDA
jgi:glutamine synthetase